METAKLFPAYVYVTLFEVVEMPFATTDTFLYK